MVNFTLPSTTNEMIPIFTSQTLRSWEVLFHLRRPMVFLFLNLYDKPGLAPLMNALFWGTGDFPVSYSNWDTSCNAWNRHSGSFIIDTGILFSNMKSPSRECWMSFWSLTNSDFPTDQTFHQLNDLYTECDLHRIMDGFHGAFATGVACKQGMFTLSDTWFRSPFWDLFVLQLLRPNSSNFPCLHSTFHIEYLLVLSRFCFSRIFHLPCIPSDI